MTKLKSIYGEAALLTVMGSALLACDRSIDKPQAPNALPLEAAYVKPRGLLQPENIAAFVEDFNHRFEVISATGQLALISDVLDRAQRADVVDEEAHLDNDPNPKRLVTANLTYTCRGPEALTSVVDAERFGTMTMKAKWSETGL